MTELRGLSPLLGGPAATCEDSHVGLALHSRVCPTLCCLRRYDVATHHHLAVATPCAVDIIILYNTWQFGHWWPTGERWQHLPLASVWKTSLKVFGKTCQNAMDSCFAFISPFALWPASPEYHLLTLWPLTDLSFLASFLSKQTNQ